MKPSKPFGQVFCTALTLTAWACGSATEPTRATPSTPAPGPTGQAPQSPQQAQDRFVRPPEPDAPEPEPLRVADANAIEADRRTFDAVAEVALGQRFGGSAIDAATLFNLGLAADPNDANALVRMAHVDLSGDDVSGGGQRLVLCDMPQMPRIDAIAISTVARPHVAVPYIYDTLRSLFDNFPDSAQVNLMVGGAEWGYLAPEVLQAEIGPERQARTHVWLPPVETSDFLRGQDACRRGSWNFARSLLSYHGTRGLLLLEDDVRWTKHSSAPISRLLDDSGLHFVSFYNNHCLGDMPHIATVAQDRGLQMHVSTVGAGFRYCTQGLYVSPEVTHSLGRHQMLRINSKCWDGLAGNFLRQQGIAVGYIYPSVLQHEGKQSSGAWQQHDTPCFLEEIQSD